MQCQQFIINIFERISLEMEKALDGLTLDELNKQPGPDTNSIGWLAWHLTRCHDRANTHLLGGEQLWIEGKWHARFNRPADPQDLGVGHKAEDLAAFKSPEVRILLDYYHSVLEVTKRYIANLSEADLDRKLDNPMFPTVETRLIATINDSCQHVGQIAYVRGLL